VTRVRDAAGPAPVLVVDCAAKSFGARRVLSAGSLRAVPGQVRAMFGRNGVGKSTLLKIAVGWIQPDSGTVFFLGQALERATLPRLAQEGLCYWPDEGLLSPAFSIGRQLEFFARQYPGGDDPEGAADRVRVRDLLGRRPSSLSGGERRRADVAAALVRRPRCLIADEPYRGVAPVDAEILTAAFGALAATGCAVVVTGHDAPTLLGAADHVTWCVSGTTYELGGPAEAQAHDGFRREYLGLAWARHPGVRA
jgi:ABC-type multidrug transport system ATPase subunit